MDPLRFRDTVYDLFLSIFHYLFFHLNSRTMPSEKTLQTHKDFNSKNPKHTTISNTRGHQKLTNGNHSINEMSKRWVLACIAPHLNATSHWRPKYSAESPVPDISIQWMLIINGSPVHNCMVPEPAKKSIMHRGHCSNILAQFETYEDLRLHSRFCASIWNDHGRNPYSSPNQTIEYREWELESSKTFLCVMNGTTFWFFSGPARAADTDSRK